VNTKSDFSISRNTKFYTKLKFISRNFAKLCEILYQQFCEISWNFVQ
jgi:hypothetical protein